MTDKPKKIKKLILSELEYCYVINKTNGKIKLVSGPNMVRYRIGLRKAIHGKRESKIILHDGEYAVVLNPFVKAHKGLRFGDREVRVGPKMFPLYPGEELENGVQKARILSRDEGLILRAIKDFDDGDEKRRAGDEWIVKGPVHYIPTKYVEIVSRVKEKSIQQHYGLYIKNNKTGDIRLEIGPKNVILGPDDELWKKDYTQSELEAVRFERDFDRTVAHPLWVLENEVTKIMSEKEQKIIFGPSVIILQPFERPFVQTIAGGTPKNTKRLKIWKIKLGPNFSTDIIEVRTKDNAVISIRLRYQWKFTTDRDNADWDPETIFGTNDFVGLMTEMMASKIRDEAAKHDFEELHSQSSEIVKAAIFGDDDHYEFDNGLNVFTIDIKEIIPKDTDIAKKMNDAIKSNMNIYVNKMNENAAIELQKTKMDGQMEIEKKKEELLKIEHANKKAEELLSAEIEAEKIRKTAEAEADAIKMKKEAEKNAEVGKIKEIIDAIGNDGANYLKLQQIQALGSIKKIIVPEKSSMFLPSDLMEND